MVDELQDTGHSASSNKPVKLAVFDFDGTSISGNSPVILVRYLYRHKLISKSILLRIVLWALAYKLRLPQNESWVRGLVFRAFCGKQQTAVDQFLREFYDSEVDRRFRPKANETMKQHQKAGDVVIIVSATFEPIIKRAMDFHPIDHQISTRMHVDNTGAYTCEVEGNPVEGAEKVNAVTRFANAEYGEGNWELAYAYGDHHSDRELLQVATHAFAIDPDHPLRRTVSKEGWQILNWE